MNLEVLVISNCLNPACRAPFNHLHDGRIFSVDGALRHSDQRDSSLRQVEQFWLCGTCSQSVKVVIEHGRISTAPIEVEQFALAG